MYENNFSENNAIKVNKTINDGCGYCSCLELDKDAIAKQEELFELAENWLNSKGITTRTEYNNILPTYNLFIEIGKYIEEQNSKELKDCPFCGSQVEMKSHIFGTPFGRYNNNYLSGYEFSIKCDDCGCTTTECTTTARDMTEEEAKAKVANAWNKRHE